MPAVVVVGGAVGCWLVLGDECDALGGTVGVADTSLGAARAIACCI